MTLRELQEKTDAWIKENGGYWSEFEILARMTEELGEIASDLQREKGLRPRKQETDVAGEVGDVLNLRDLVIMGEDCGVLLLA